MSSISPTNNRVGESKNLPRPGLAEATEGNGDTSAAAADQTARTAPSQPRWRRLVVALVLVAAVPTTTAFIVSDGGRQSTNDAYVSGNLVRISPQVAAPVAAIYIDDNQLVDRDDLLVELDPTDFEVALR